jgi:hypothetical protein
MPGAKRKDRGPEYLKKLVNYFTEREEKQAQAQEKEAAVKEKESAVRNMQALLSTGELSPSSKQKFVQSIANMLLPSSL